MKDFSIYRKLISLPDFLKDHGFSDYKKGSTKNNPKFSNGDITVVVRKKKNGEYDYFDVNNPDAKLTILDFMQQELTKINNGALVPLPIVANELDKYIATGLAVLPEFSNYNLDNPNLSEDDINRIILNLHKSGSNDFFLKRGISEKTLETPAFKNIIRYRKAPTNNRISHDIAFIMHGLSSCKAISYRGVRNGMDETFKGFHGPKGENIVASIHDKAKPLDVCFIGESMIDCIAHYELNQKKLSDKNFLYISSEGSLTHSQIQLIQVALNSNNPKTISTIFDNDLYGTQASTLIHSSLAISKNSLGITGENPSTDMFLNLSKIEVPIISQKFTKASFKFSIPNAFHEKALEHIQGIIHPINSNITLLKDKFSIKHTGTEKNKSLYELNFPNNKFAWKTANDIIIAFKFSNSNLFKPEFPKNKDFNLDLIEYKGLTKALENKKNGISFE